MEQKAPTPHERLLPRFSDLGLLLVLIIFFILAPFLSKGVYVRLILDLTILSSLILSVYLCSNNKRHLLIALLLAGPALLRLFYPSVEIDKMTLLCNAGFFAFVISMLLKRLFQTTAVTQDVIYAAIAVYFLLGVFWGLIYTLLEFFVAHSFILPHSMGGNTLYAEFGQDLLYYSFITMTTVGYGDILPLSQPAKFLSVLEAMMGQIYLTVLVARLVGTYITQKKVARQEEPS
jgi:hypothetical protein